MGSYALGTWTTSAKQDKGLFRLFNRQNAGLISAAITAGTIINNGGTGYVGGNVLTLVDSGTTTTPATFTVTAIGAGGAVTGVALVPGVNTGGVYASHQAANNHATTGGAGTGCVLAINFYQDVPNMVTRNGGVLDKAVSSYLRQRDQELIAAMGAAIESATENQIGNAAAAFGLEVPA